MKRFMFTKSLKPRLSIRDVAKRAKCSVGSASKVLNDSTEVSPAMKERVLQAAAELGYVPNRHAQNLKSGRTYRLGLLLPFASDLYYATLLDAFNEMIMEQGYRLDVQLHRWIEKEETAAIRYFVESGMEGIIMIPCRLNYEKAPGISLLEQYRMPCVILGKDQISAPSERISEVSQDFSMGTELLAEHLMSMGHRNIALLMPAPNSKQAAMRERIDGVKKVLSRYPGSALDEVYLQAQQDHVPAHKDFRLHGTSISIFQDYINKLVEKFLNQKKECTAAITINQVTAWTLIDALKEKGIRVPEDFSVVSMGLSNTEHFGGFPLTMAEYSPTQMAKNALDALLKNFLHPEQIQPTLVCRKSSAPHPQPVSSTPSPKPLTLHSNPKR